MKASTKQKFGKLSGGLVISPVVKIRTQLIAADHLIKGNGKPNRDRPGAIPFAKLGNADYKRLLDFSKEAVEGSMDYLYYTGCNMEGGCIAGMTLLNRPKSVGSKKGDFTWEFDVCYALTGPVAFSELRKEVDGIFKHWKWSGDVTYRLKLFKQHQYVASYCGLS